MSMKPAVRFHLSAMMFLQFFIWGAWYVSTGNYMGAHGMAHLIGWAYTVGPIAALVSPFFLGMVADRFFPVERVLGVLHLLGAGFMLLAPQVTGSTFILVLLGHMLCYMPTLGLTNTLAFHHVNEPEKDFPLIRVLGTIGWIVAALVVSGIFGADRMALQYYVTAAAGFCLGLYSFVLPHTPPPARGKVFSWRQAIGLDALALLKDRSFLVFIAASFLICIPLAAYYAFAQVFVGDAGFLKPAANMSFGQMAEIVFMLVMPWFFRRLGVKWMLAVGMLAWALRYALFSFGAPEGVAWMILGGILLHGICYDFFFVTGFIYTDGKAHKEIRGQAQGFLVLVTQGLGLGIGAQVSQALYDRMVGGEGAARLASWQNFWLVPCIAAALFLVLFVLFFRDRKAA